MDLNLLIVGFIVGGMLLAIWALVKLQAPLVAVAVLLLSIGVLIARLAGK